ncbi:hypothetical protein ACFQZ0_13580 [Streptomyces erythrogriseus]
MARVDERGGGVHQDHGGGAQHAQQVDVVAPLPAGVRSGVSCAADGTAAGDAGEDIGGALLAAGSCGGRFRRFPLPGYGAPTTT